MDENQTYSQSAIATALDQIAGLNRRDKLCYRHLTTVNNVLQYGCQTQGAPMKLIAYTRVSTQRQGQSGLGMEAQHEAIEAYAKASGGEVVAGYTEVESGKRSDRPELAKAVAHAKRIKGRLVIAKLDRLARNAAFVLNIMESGVDFVACDNPHANRLTVQILAAVAENEARATSERTKAALAAAKARGVKLGSARPGHWKGREEARMRGMAAAQAAAQKHYAEKGAPVYSKALPIAREMQGAGASLQAIADRLNAEGITTPQGAEWKRVQVARLLKRA
jgi:DNA invertase Pin-like site-specific DNA recombinase